MGMWDPRQISVNLVGDVAVVSLAGDLDFCVEQEVTDALISVIAVPGLVRLTVDVDAVSFFGSSGVRCLLLARESAIERGVQFNVAPSSNKSVRRILDLFGSTDAQLVGAST
jgi:anti-sigma B factor antagonist